MRAELAPGLVVLHGNRLELLRDAVLDCFARWPLGALEEEVVLVPSNGAGEWFKATQAERSGICAASRVELPARFVWRLYRQLLGREALPAQSPLDKRALTWRLLRLLPRLDAGAEYARLTGYLHGGDAECLLQLAQRLADLYDQYQIYRADWLDCWSRGVDVLIDARDARRPLPEAQRWQAALWRALLAGLEPEQRAAARPQVQRAALARLRAEAAPQGLPRRVTLFGAATIPGPTLELLIELARHAQVVIALPNPCQYHWADSIDGRELLRTAQRRQALRGDVDLAAVALEAMHAHAHPLLAAWGRQGRDFMRQLDAFEAEAGRRLELPRTDLFDPTPPRTLLEQVQAAIRDLLPLAEHPQPRGEAAAAVRDDDRSIVFQVAHSAQREVEILHDQLLELLGSAQPPLRPRDIVVMVPQIEDFAPAIRAVFGQYPRGDARHIPFDIADLASRGASPLLQALEWLLGIGTRRCSASELRDLLDVPGIAARFGLADADKPQLARWIHGAGVRWGLDAEQRAALGLGACGDVNSWRAGLRRMLLGYANGATAFHDIEPFDEIGGLDAGLVGVLAALLDALERWSAEAALAARPAQWAQRARRLLQDWVDPADARERVALAALHDALEAWLEDCAAAGFDAELPLAVFREAWLDGVDEPGQGGRFLAGGVTFCSLLPLRSVPFEVVCLLGMNDGDYPRAAPQSDFDLMALAGQFRPGDRSRRDDDRYLMLEALLAARRVLSVSWCGRSAQDNAERPPSVLVAQLRDYLQAGWGDGELPRQLTTVHPLQPFSRRYFEGGALRTYAREWRAAHAAPGDEAATAARGAPAADAAMRRATEAPLPDGAELVPGVRALAGLLRNPVKTFFRARLDVVFDADDETSADDEAFGLDGLERHQLLVELVTAPPQDLRDAATLRAGLEARRQRLRGSGRLPLAGSGARVEQQLADFALPMLHSWRALMQRHAEAAPRQALRYEHAELRFDDWLDGLRSGGTGPVWIGLSASALRARKQPLAAHKLLEPWVRMLAASSCGLDCRGWLIGRDAVLELPALPAALARTHLQQLLQAWRDGMREPLPWGARTALAQLEGANAWTVYAGDDRGARGEASEPCLARVYPDFDALRADGRFDSYARELFAPLSAWAQGEVRVHEHAEIAEPGDA
jgi:exodeoxyribonuclease V gamma subunit